MARAALADKASANGHHGRTKRWASTQLGHWAGGWFRSGTRIFRKTNLFHFGCNLSVISITRSDRGVDGSYRDRRPSKRLKMVSCNKNVQPLGFVAPEPARAKRSAMTEYAAGLKTSPRCVPETGKSASGRSVLQYRQSTTPSPSL